MEKKWTTEELEKEVKKMVVYTDAQKVMENLIDNAFKALNEKQVFNEIELTNGNLKVRLVRFTPAPVDTMYPPGAWAPAWPYKY